MVKYHLITGKKKPRAAARKAWKRILYKDTPFELHTQKWINCKDPKEKCSICLCSNEEEKLNTRLVCFNETLEQRCNHYFHWDCILRNVKEGCRVTCPLCRRRIDYLQLEDRNGKAVERKLRSNLEDVMKKVDYMNIIDAFFTLAKLKINSIRLYPNKNYGNGSNRRFFVRLSLCKNPCCRRKDHSHAIATSLEFIKWRLQVPMKYSPISSLETLARETLLPLIFDFSPGVYEHLAEYRSSQLHVVDVEDKTVIV